MNSSSEWQQAALAAATKADAFSSKQVAEIMAYEQIPLKEMEDWCEQLREDQPCMFRGRIVYGIPYIPPEERK